MTAQTPQELETPVRGIGSELATVLADRLREDAVDSRLLARPPLRRHVHHRPCSRELTLQQGRVAACRSDEACAVAVEHPVVPQQRVALFNVRNDSSVDQPHIQQLLHD